MVIDMGRFSYLSKTTYFLLVVVSKKYLHMSKKWSKPPSPPCHLRAAIAGLSSWFVFLGHLCLWLYKWSDILHYQVARDNDLILSTFNIFFTINCDRERQFSCFLFICLMVSTSASYSSMQKRRRKQFPQDWQKRIPNKDQASRQCLQSELQHTSPVW